MNLNFQEPACSPGVSILLSLRYVLVTYSNVFFFLIRGPRRSASEYKSLRQQKRAERYVNSRMNE